MKRRALPKKQSKIMATLGPASMNRSKLGSMIQRGTDIIRLNASHNADPNAFIETVKLVREVAEAKERYVAIVMDLQGPKIRVGLFENGKAELKTGQDFTLTQRDVLGNHEQAYISYSNFTKDVAVGDAIFIDDGKIRLVVKEVHSKDVICTVKRGGKISNNKGVNLPDTQMTISPFTQKDQGDALAAIKSKVDYIALSFVSSAKDIKNFRKFLHENNAENIQIIAKIERQIALDNLAEILDETDAVMVARGDLGVEIGVEKVPKTQKMIIRESNRRIKPVIVATQMLESMITSETATRAEVSDIANAIYDSCDAVMLSGETAVGINPPNVIKTMANICVATDRHIKELKRDYRVTKKRIFTNFSKATSFCKAAEQVAEENNAKAILAFTSSGNTPLIASKLQSLFPILAPTDSKHLCRRMMLYRGVTPMLLPKKFTNLKGWSEMINLAVTQAKQVGYLKTGDTIVITAGIPLGQTGGVNSIRIITVE